MEPDEGCAFIDEYLLARENVPVLETDPKIPWSMVEGLVWSGTRKPFPSTATILVQFNGGPWEYETEVKKD